MQDLYLHPEVLKFFDDHFAPLLGQEGVYVFDDLLLVRDLIDEIRSEWTGVIDSQHDIQVLLGNCQGLLEGADESLRVHCLVANFRLFVHALLCSPRTKGCFLCNCIYLSTSASMSSLYSPSGILSELSKMIS